MLRSLIIAHRGASCVAPENTLAAIQLAWGMGSDAVEIDIRLTKDCEIIAVHDASTDRTTGESHSVSSLSLAELKGLDAGSFKGEQWRGEPVPTLREILAIVPPGRKMLIEIKGTSAILLPLKKVLNEAGLESRQIFLISFDFELAVNAKTLLPNYQVLWLTGEYHECPEERWPQLTRSLIRKIHESHLDGIDLGACRPFPPESFRPQLREFLATGIQVFLWTINDPAMARWLNDLPVHGITTDVPDVLLRLRDETSQGTDQGRQVPVLQRVGATAR